MGSGSELLLWVVPGCAPSTRAAARSLASCSWWALLQSERSTHTEIFMLATSPRNGHQPPLCPCSACMWMSSGNTRGDQTAQQQQHQASLGRTRDAWGAQLLAWRALLPRLNGRICSAGTGMDGQANG